ncbi:hypothetical protein SteCoe_10165 [Stentor coeruleus]|uniref:Uncharacterized protein n=1 Tax=Stentor coeruleus TaxID=5963 RepID=A0A1R2CG56_9CILI|nr:hypothetical protein SteCoe_10165 [Stentor coeruleus]
MKNIYEKTGNIAESYSRHSARSSPNKSFVKERFQLPNLESDVKDMSEITFAIEDFETKIFNNLDIIKDIIESSYGMIRSYKEDLKSEKHSNSYSDVEIILTEKDMLLKENDMLREEMNQLKLNWSSELESARVQWNKGLDKMQMTYEANIKELTESHKAQLDALKQIHKEKLQVTHNSYKETEKSFIEKFEIMTEDQTGFLNKLNDKIIYLTSKNNEDNLFIEKVCNNLEEICEKYDIMNKKYHYVNNKEKILSKIDDIAEVFEKNKGGVKKVQRNENKSGVYNLKEKLIENSLILKEFEEARSKLVKHFDESPKKGFEFQYPFTTRY